MNHQLSFFPCDEDDVLSDFLIVINPPDNIGKDVKQFKTEFYERFGSYPSRHSEPHITIADIHCLPKNEAKVISFIKDYHPRGSFLAKINGFAGYEGNDNRVIHLQIEKSKEFEMLEKYYNQKKSEFHRYKKRFYVSENPHVTIARNLRWDVFEAAKKVYLSRPYGSTFMAKRLIILRRELFKRSATP